ncbi:MAG TPA: histidine kinase [Chthoniobacterales bacterium]
MPTAIRHGLRDWASWAILTPLLFRFSARFPLGRPRKYVVWPAHALVFVLSMAFLHIWKGGVDWAFSAAAGQSNETLQLHQPPPLRSSETLLVGEEPLPPAINLFGYFTFELPIYLMLVASAHLLLYRRRLEERAAGLTRARLEALKAQLQPHFLFNTLNTIAGLVHEQPDKADAMLVALSDLLRLSLETSSEVELPLGREMEYVERYLAIIGVRFDGRIGHSMDVDSDARNALVPAFILQPLVENAVQHGLLPRPEGGSVTVTARRQGARLRIIVSDDGLGFRSRPDATEGIGLGNARARLEQLYGDDAVLEMYDGPLTQVILEVPYRTAP